jgi:two-component system cell cycle response regulator
VKQAELNLSAQNSKENRNEERAARILIADDDPINLALMRMRLEREGYEVLVVNDGSEAAAVAQQERPDLIILDVMMPVMDGFEACRFLKTHPSTRDIPVIFLSARDETEAKVGGLSLGANDFISKPFRPEELLARVAVALRLKREREELLKSAEEAQRRAEKAHEMSMSDALTGLLNRYGLIRTLAHEIAEARRYGRPLACLMIDVDKFKQINDAYGHPAGDAALAQVGRILTESVRGSDVVCRYGGEEFLALLPETDLQGALTVGEKIRRATAKRRFGEGERIFHLTLSIGAAQLRDDESGNDMIARADAALYEAKRQGRNRVVKAD